MGLLVGAAGRIPVNSLVRAAVDVAGTDAAVGGWGVAYCYGNRLETKKSVNPCTQDPEFALVPEIRTDMALLCIGGEKNQSYQREVRPYTRREVGHTWAFCHYGTVRHPDRLDTGGRITDSANPSERLFLHLLNRVSLQDPVESATRALEALGEEPALSFCLLSADMMLVGSWHDDAPETSDRLWAGEGLLVRYFCSKPVETLDDVSWEQMPNRTILALMRTRREL